MPPGGDTWDVLRQERYISGAHEVDTVAQWRCAVSNGLQDGFTELFLHHLIEEVQVWTF